MTTSAAALSDPNAEEAAGQYHAYLEQIGRVYFHVYASSAVRPLAAEELHQLLVTSRQNNLLLGISGLLLYKDGNFLQVLEGREAAVLGLVEKITYDRRHRDVTTLLQGFQSECQFPAWSMGFRDLRSQEAQANPGYNEILDPSLDPRAFASDPLRAQRLLLAFKEIL